MDLGGISHVMFFLQSGIRLLMYGFDLGVVLFSCCYIYSPQDSTPKPKPSHSTPLYTCALKIMTLVPVVLVKV